MSDESLNSLSDSDSPTPEEKELETVNTKGIFPGYSPYNHNPIEISGSHFNHKSSLVTTTVSHTINHNNNQYYQQYTQNNNHNNHNNRNNNNTNKNNSSIVRHGHRNVAKQSNQIVTLNVGGTKYQTTIGTLTKYPHSHHMLSCMFGGQFSMKPTLNGDEHFIDANGDIFKYILQFLRHGEQFSRTVLPNLCKTSLSALELESKYFGLYELMFEPFYALKTTFVNHEITLLSNKINKFDILRISKNGLITTTGIGDAGGNGNGKLIIHCNQLIIDSGGVISVNGKGCKGGRYNRAGRSPLDKIAVQYDYKVSTPGAGGKGCGGGGYGTCGYDGNIDENGGTVYGDKFLSTVFVGAGGGGGYDDNNRGAGQGYMQVLPGRHRENNDGNGDGGGEEMRGTAGGGAIIIECKERLVVCDGGVICANGENNYQVNTKKGCGSGGSIYIKAPKVVNEGIICAIGGRNITFNNNNNNENKENMENIDNIDNMDSSDSEEGRDGRDGRDERKESGENVGSNSQLFSSSNSSNSSLNDVKGNVHNSNSNRNSNSNSNASHHFSNHALFINNRNLPNTFDLANLSMDNDDTFGNGGDGRIRIDCGYTDQQYLVRSNIAPKVGYFAIYSESTGNDEF